MTQNKLSETVGAAPKPRHGCGRVPGRRRRTALAARRWWSTEGWSHRPPRGPWSGGGMVDRERGIKFLVKRWGARKVMSAMSKKVLEKQLHVFIWTLGSSFRRQPKRQRGRASPPHPNEPVSTLWDRWGEKILGKKGWGLAPSWPSDWMLWGRDAPGLNTSRWPLFEKRSENFRWKMNGGESPRFGGF